jgi:hypothetical protein
LKTPDPSPATPFNPVLTFNRLSFVKKIFRPSPKYHDLALSIWQKIEIGKMKINITIDLMFMIIHKGIC